ncbi:serine/threonine kinase family protein, partial [Plesiocystis pacifica SIR-1]
FMAPEQFRGEVVDARADQFSFCVALHLALWGAEPAGPQAQAARERGDVPAWIGAVVDRGLAQDSNERWPSMVELLAALRDDPAARRRRWGAVAMAVTVAVGVGLGAWQVERERVQSCAEVSGGAAQLWGEARQAELRAAMLATDTDYAEDTWARVSMRLDEWSHDWASARAQTCGRPDAAEHARCLDAQLVDAEALVDVVGDSERANLAEVLGLVASLPEPQLCERPAYRAVRGRSALDDRQRERRAELARVWALRGGGRHGEARARARALLESIERDREAALWSEASVSWGRAALSAGDYVDAREGLEAGYFAASGSGLDRVAFEASVGLVELATERAEFELGALWVRQAEVLAERMGDAGGDRAAVAVARGRLLARAGELEAAESVLDEAAEAVASSHAPGDPLGAQVALERGELARAMGEHARSRRLVEGARTTLLTVLGGSHPHLVEVELALARIERDEGDLRGARSRVESALERQVRVHGREHPAVVETLVELAVILARQGSVDEAREREAEARAVAVATLGRDHPRVAWIGDSLAAEMRRGLDE